MEKGEEDRARGIKKTMKERSWLIVAVSVFFIMFFLGIVGFLTFDWHALNEEKARCKPENNCNLTIEPVTPITFIISGAFTIYELTAGF